MADLRDRLLAPSEGDGRRGLGVFVVEHHELLRRGLRAVVEDDGGMRVVGEAASLEQAVAGVGEARPHVVVMDLRLPDARGGSVAHAVREAGAGVPVLVLTSDGDDSGIVEAVQSGAAGYLRKDAPASEVVRAIREVAEGRSLIDPGVAAQLLEQARTSRRRAGRLTPQEQRILDLLAEGLSNRAIGARLGVAEKTVKNHVSSLLAKLGASNRTEAALIGARARAGS